MFGIRHATFDAMTFVLHYRKGRLIRQGRGLSFFYYAPDSSIVAIPMASHDLPFIFSATSQDFQKLTVQGQITYQISEPSALADVLDFTVDKKGHHKQQDLEKLHQRIINEAQSATTNLIQQTPILQAIRSNVEIETEIREGLAKSQQLTMLGVEILGVHVLAVAPAPEMAKALETETRERMQQEADEAIYQRRNFAVEQERKIKESELNTEIAVEVKQQEITQQQMTSKVMKAENERQLHEMRLKTEISMQEQRLEADILQEEQRRTLLETKNTNDRSEADTKAYALQAFLNPYKDLDWQTLAAIQGISDPEANIALAFRQMANQADKIGQLNITPDLLQSLLKSK
ncbi:SPFH domain-containing protein [Pontibacter sp. G13]|uniref:SPFH domain-containing protein n=1 Tax=Pontibacter sp. G13 TaxID=3074898 RepID=UPI002889182E|nr:SPFH domain-containing protein [Pontibacter sp. G13]WNJ17517.1 SPFH domain-containing protein [Pontibacter sp. G13]